MCRCCRRSWPRPTPSSWPVSSAQRDPPLHVAAAAGFSLAGLNVYSGAHGVHKNGRFGGGDRSRRLGRVRRDRSGRSRADTPPPSAPASPSEPASPSAPAYPAAKTTIDADGTYAVGTDIQPGVYSSAGPVGDGACYWKRVSGSNIVDNALSKKSQIVQIDATDTAFTTNECQPWQLTDAPVPVQGPGDLLGQLAQLAPIIARNPGTAPPPTNP